MMPDHFLRGYDPITVIFPSDTGPKGGGPEDHPQRHLKLEPAAPGEARWADARTLVFRPAVPWPALASYQVQAGGLSRRLVTLLSAPLQVSHAGGNQDLEAFQEVNLRFSAPIPTEKLAQMIRFELRPLPGAGNKGLRRLGPEDFSLKALERATQNDAANVALRLKRAVGPGWQIRLQLCLALDEKLPQAYIHYTFTTRVPFRILAVGCDREWTAPPPPPQAPRTEEGENPESGENPEGGEYQEAPPPPPPVHSTPERSLLPLTLAGSKYGPEQALEGGSGAPRIVLQFSEALPPLSLSEIKALVRFSPSIPDLSASQNGAFLVLTGKIQRETLYKAEIRPVPIHSARGKLLQMEGPSEFHFFYPRQHAYLNWAQSEGLVERLGPQMFPLAGRNDTAVDLRIHKIDPLDRNFWPFPRQAVVVDENSRPPGPGEPTPDANQQSQNLYTQQMAVRIQMLGSPGFSRMVKIPLRAGGDTTRFGLPLKEALAQVAGPDQPGTYLLGIRRLNEESTRSYVRIQVTDLCLSTIEEPQAVVFLVTSLKTGKPVAGAQIRLEAQENDHSRTQWRTILSGSTDATGRFRYVHHKALEGHLRRILVRAGNDSLVLQPSDPPYAFANHHWFGPSGSWLEWLRSQPQKDPEESIRMAHLLTERPVYRPEETVYLKGYVRVREKGRLKFVPQPNYEIVITDPSDREWTYPAEFTDSGSFALSFEEKDLPTGRYRATLRSLDDETTLGSVDWRMEAYRIPQFEVKLHAPDWVPMDREFPVNAVASYYAGGKVVGQDVRWRVTQFPHVHLPKDRPGWLFSSDERFSKGGRWEAPAALEKNDKTDPSGTSILKLNPGLELDARPRKYVVECTVTGADDQTVTAVKEIKALPPFFLGLKLERFIQGEKLIRPSILAVDGADKALPGQEMSLRLLKRQWHSHLKETDFSTGKAKYVTDVVEELVKEQKLISTEEPLELQLPVDEGGIYIVELSARDALGRLQLVMADLYVAGTEPLTWKKPQQNVFETASDKKEYIAGERARILVKSPFQQAQGLVVVEAPDGNSYHGIEIQGGQAVFELPIRNEYHPKLPVHIVLMRGRLAHSQMQGALDLGKPTTMAATQWIQVKPEGNRLEVQLQHPERAMPGQQVTVKIRLKDPAGKPLPGEVTLALVDQAVLSLGKLKRLDPLPSFIRDVKSRVSIRDTRNRALGEILTEENPGGSGGDEGDDLLKKTTVRKRFKTVPYYNPRILVGPSGEAQVSFQLSDDLTIFRVAAVACSGSERFGATSSNLAVRLPVAVQPALPRFARSGDSFSAGGIGRIVEGEGGPGKAQIQVQGAEISTGSTKTLAWEKDKPQRLYFPMKVTAQAGSELRVKLAVCRDKDGAADAFETGIPVLADRSPLSQTEFKRLQGKESLDFPTPREAPRPGSLRQSVLLTDQEAVLKMVGALDYLFAYHHACTEQVVSQAYPLVALKDFTQLLEQKPAQAALDAVVKRTLDYLAKTLQSNGLFAFWPGGRGYVHLTAYVVEFLSEAKKAGVAFDPKLLERPVAALKEALRSDYSHFVEGSAFSERTDALCALARAGQVDPAYGQELARKATMSDLYASSRILQAFQSGLPGETAVERLRKSLWDGTLFKLRDGKEVYGGLQTRTQGAGGLVLASELKTQASLIRALYPKDKELPRMKLIIEDLVAAGAGDGWGSTQANAQALLALREVVKAKRDSTPTCEFRLESGGASQNLKLGPGQGSAKASLQNDARARLVSVQGSPQGLSARLSLNYVPKAPGDQAAAHSEGFVVHRTITQIMESPIREALTAPGKRIQLAIGAVLEEHIQIINPENRHFVAISAPFAAGLEPLNPNLATAPAEAKPSKALSLQPSYVQYLDHEVRFYYETLPKGTYDFYYRLRASTPGSFAHPPAQAEMMYQSTRCGNSPGARVEIEEPAI